MESVLKREVLLDKTILRTLAVAFFIISITLSAFVRVPLPFTPVPLTLQTFFVLLSAAFLGLRLGVATQLSYIFLGIIGLPVFSGLHSGLFYLAQPTAGYLFGFILAAIFIASFIKYAGDKLARIIVVFCLADFLILACGTAWLKLSLHLPWVKAFYIGFFPFLSGDILKATLASALFRKLRPRIKEIL